MLMKRLLVLLIAMTGVLTVTCGQQAVPDSVAILGQWHLVSVQAEVYSQKDRELLGKKSIDPKADASQLNMGVPLGIRMTKDSCSFSGREPIAGSYDIAPGGLLRIKQVINPKFPAITKTYVYLVAPGKLELTLPSVYRQDTELQQAVKVIYHCQYKRD